MRPRPPGCRPIDRRHGRRPRIDRQETLPATVGATDPHLGRLVAAPEGVPRRGRHGPRHRRLDEARVGTWACPWRITWPSPTRTTRNGPCPRKSSTSHPRSFGCVSTGPTRWPGACLGDEVDVMFSASPTFRLVEQADAKGLRRVGWFDTKSPLRSGWAWGQERPRRRGRDRRCQDRQGAAGAVRPAGPLPWPAARDVQTGLQRHRPVRRGRPQGRMNPDRTGVSPLHEAVGSIAGSVVYSAPRSSNQTVPGAVDLRGDEDLLGVRRDRHDALVTRPVLGHGRLVGFLGADVGDPGVGRIPFGRRRIGRRGSPW